MPLDPTALTELINRNVELLLVNKRLLEENVKLLQGLLEKKRSFWYKLGNLFSRK